MKKNFKSILLFLLFVITSCLLFINDTTHKTNLYSPTNELFSPNLQKLNSIKNILIHTDSIYKSLSLTNLDTAAYVELLSDVFKKRFHHGLANYSISQNWIAYFLGKTCWSHFSAIVNANDIIKYSEGLCSQQNIVFIKALKNKGITYRMVSLGNKEGPGHFVIEVKYNNCWHMYDIDLEPNWSKIDFNRKSMDYLLTNKTELFKIYENRIDKNLLKKVIIKVSYTEPNITPAKNMLFFHKFTKLITYIMPFIFLMLSLYFIKKEK